MLTILLSAWIAVMNPDGIANANVTFNFGQECLLESFVSVTPVNQERDTTLYQVKQSRRVFGATCPNGTLFLMEPHILQRKQEEEKKEGIDLERLRQDIINRLKQ